MLLFGTLTQKATTSKKQSLAALGRRRRFNHISMCLRFRTLLAFQQPKTNLSGFSFWLFRCFFAFKPLKANSFVFLPLVRRRRCFNWFSLWFLRYWTPRKFLSERFFLAWASVLNSKLIYKTIKRKTYSAMSKRCPHRRSTAAGEHSQLEPFSHILSVFQKNIFFYLPCTSVWLSPSEDCLLNSLDFWI